LCAGSRAKLIEYKANGSPAIQMLAHEIPGRRRNSAGHRREPSGRGGNIYLVHPKWRPHDQVDAMTQALLL